MVENLEVNIYIFLKTVFFSPLNFKSKIAKNKVKNLHSWKI